MFVVLYDVNYHVSATNRNWTPNRTRICFNSGAAQRHHAELVCLCIFFKSVRPSTQRSWLGGPRRSFPEAFIVNESCPTVKFPASYCSAPWESACALRLGYDGGWCIRSVVRWRRLWLAELCEAPTDHFTPPELGESCGSVSIRD